MQTVLSSGIRQKVSSYMKENREELIKGLQKLIQIPSETGYEGPVQEHIQKVMLNLGLEVDTFEADPVKVRQHPEYTESEVERRVGFKGRPNVVGKWAGSEDARSLLLFTHIDTVPIGDLVHWSYPPTEGVIENGLMYGRGTADNKGGYGSVLAALEVIKGMGLKPKGNITTIAVVDEEVGGAGGAVAMVQYLEEQNFTADACIYPHPLTTGAGPQIACAGGLIFKVRVTGLAAHNLNGQVGVNAIGKAMKIYDALVELDNERVKTVSYAPFERYFAASDMQVRSSNLTPAMINAGEWAYKVPAECELTGTIGYPPNETVEEVKAQIENAIKAVAENDEWLSQNPPEISYEWHTSPAEISPDHPFVQMVKKNIDDVVGRTTEIYGMPTFSDIRFPLLYMNMPAIIYGPKGGNLHGADEWVNIQDWLDCVETNVLNILEWSGFEEIK
ncbi:MULTISPECIES: ArgE/DapE family deacylase [Neobacillus]|uniref:ArgE/DapE family deacylase n=1 Tax=Neobacillus citreus TaxID=2833578 RepID=A0A942T6T1_9BACI|nr:ArgE/DapE family deacylase [Neobacillus citreus]MCH6264481.1 ArgE/DapE family deacylase [Neobacillus citreus]